MACLGSCCWARYCRFTCLWFSLPMWTPLTSMMRSPGLSPASSAGDPGSTFPINCPCFTFPANKLKPNPSKSGRFTTWQRRGAGASGGNVSIFGAASRDGDDNRQIAGFLLLLLLQSKMNLKENCAGRKTKNKTRNGRWRNRSDETDK